jgi:uncharacterized protein with HEPN domain
MPPVERDIIILKKIVKYCDEISEANEAFGNKLEALTTSSVYRNAVSMCILQIGELAANLTDEFLREYTGVPWQAMRRMRNVAAHHYGKFDVDILWATISDRVPELRAYCENIITKQ